MPRTSPTILEGPCLRVRSRYLPLASIARIATNMVANRRAFRFTVFRSLQREPIQERKISGQQFQVVHENEHSDRDQQNSADDFDGVQVTAKTGVETEKAVHP